jgi:osmotically inducible protein OsmC
MTKSNPAVLVPRCEDAEDEPAACCKHRDTVDQKGHNMKRKASAEWKGGLKDGKGTISTDSGVLANTQYSFGTRFEEGKGTNPEELIAAAHAGCFSMALSGQLGNSGLTAERINTTATVTLEKTDAGFTVTSVHLDVSVKIPGADKQAFETAANNAKSGCPISRLLNTKITMDAKLES